MKLSRILPAVAAGAIACPNAQLPNHEVNLNALFRRAVDPSTMDPVRLSVLEVLKTAMPTGSNLALPTGTAQPDWYKNLPQDVKNLLPSLYPLPATVAAAAITPTSAVPYVATSASSSVPSSTSSKATSSKATSSIFPSSKTSNAYIASSTASGNYSVATSRPASANATLPTGASLSAPPLPTRTFSTGTKTAIRMETLTALMWLGLGAGFLIFA